MEPRLHKTFLPLAPENVCLVRGYLGVYELQDAAGDTALIAYAGGRSLFGLRGELERELAARAAGYRFRYEVNMQYMTRYKELLMVHIADHGRLPRENQAAPPTLGRLMPLPAP
jgi:hypothetical protein